MQPTSPLYDAQMKSQIALPCCIRIRCGLVDHDAGDECTMPAAPQQTFYSRPDSMLHDPRVPQSSYATLEPGRMRADGVLRILPHNAQAALYSEGLVSKALCGADGTFEPAEIPQISFSFPTLHSIPGLSFVFDCVCGDYPAEFVVEAFRGQTRLFSRSYSPAHPVFSTNDGIDLFDRLTLRFLRMNAPRRRLRIAQLTFGFGVTFSDSEIIRAVQKSEVDPISRRLPHSTLDFTVVNINSLTGSGEQCLYNPDNPRGIFRYIGRQNPISLEYGQTLEDGSIYWISGGQYELTGQPDTNGLSARFTAQDALSGLSGTFTKGILAAEGQTLYALAQQVLDDSGLRRTPQGQKPWKLWSGLKNLRTAAPLPIRKHKELLQLIAHAACCVLFTDRQGFIRIEPAACPPDTLVVDSNEMLEYPRVREIPTLRAVHCPAYSYTAEENASQLHRETYAVNGTQVLELRYPMCADAKVTAQGAVITKAEIYAAAAHITLEGTGSAVVTVTGRKLTASTRDVRADVPLFDASSCEEYLDNPLITSCEDASRVAHWVKDWLCLRSTYSFAYRGRPELDALDLLRIESPFSAQPVPVRVLKTELTYDGGLQGTLCAKNLAAAEE